MYLPHPSRLLAVKRRKDLGMDTQGLTRGRELAGMLATIMYQRRIERRVATKVEETLAPYKVEATRLRVPLQRSSE